MIHKYFDLCLSCPLLLPLGLFHLFDVFELTVQILKRVQITFLFLWLETVGIVGNLELGRSRILILVVCNT